MRPVCGVTHIRGPSDTVDPIDVKVVPDVSARTTAPPRAGCAGAQQTLHPHVGVAAIDACSAVAATEDKTMKIWPILSFLVPVGALALLGVRRLLGRRIVSREVAALQELRRPGRELRKIRR